MKQPDIDPSGSGEGLLNNGGFAPTQMDAQNSIQRKRMGAVRLPSDSVKK